MAKQLNVADYNYSVKEAKIVKARDTLDVALYCWRS